MKPADSSTHINWHTNPPTLRSPVLITAFEGEDDIGGAGSIAASHFSKRWKGVDIAEVDGEHFYDFAAIRPQIRLNQLHRRSLKWPSSVFRVCVASDSERDVVLLTGPEPHLRWRMFCEEIIRTARILNVSEVVTLGEALEEVPHSRPVTVYGATDDQQLQTRLDLEPACYEGPTGIEDVLADQCRQAGLPAVSLWSAVPSYIPGAPSAKAALALVQRVSNLLGVSVFATDLELAAATYEQRISALVAENEDVADYVADLEQTFDDAEISVNRGVLLTEVEQFLRNN